VTAPQRPEWPGMEAWAYSSAYLAHLAHEWHGYGLRLEARAEERATYIAEIEAANWRKDQVIVCLRDRIGGLEDHEVRNEHLEAEKERLDAQYGDLIAAFKRQSVRIEELEAVE
jgi:hypothetical protein